MSQTRLQSANVRIPGVEHYYHTLEKRPIIDPSIQDRVTLGNMVRTMTKDGTLYQWFHDGDVCRTAPDGTITTWWSAPTMNDMINRTPDEAMYCRFYSSGAIGMRLYNKDYYWGPLISGEPIIGENQVTTCYCEDCYDDYGSWYGRMECFCCQRN